jgi:hypothetical protein
MLYFSIFILGIFYRHHNILLSSYVLESEILSRPLVNGIRVQAIFDTTQALFRLCRTISVVLLQTFLNNFFASVITKK